MQKLMAQNNRWYLINHSRHCDNYSGHLSNHYNDTLLERVCYKNRNGFFFAVYKAY